MQPSRRLSSRTSQPATPQLQQPGPGLPPGARSLGDGSQEGSQGGLEAYAQEPIMVFSSPRQGTAPPTSEAAPEGDGDAGDAEGLAPKEGSSGAGGRRRSGSQRGGKGKKGGSGAVGEAGTPVA
jgi:hypothetical protein